jgi:hypothetical protein
MDPVSIVSNSESYIKRFRLYGIKTTFKFNRVPEGVNEIDWLRRGFSSLVGTIKAHATETDYIGFTLTSLNLQTDRPGYVAYQPVNKVDEDTLWNIFGSIIQSNAESIKSTDTFRVEATRVNLPTGSGKRRPGYYNNFIEECCARSGIVTIKNMDNLCLARALVVAKAYAKKKDRRTLDRLRKDSKKLQTIKAKSLIAKARVEIPEDGAGIQELQKFQDHLKKYNIVVYNYNNKGRDVYFDGTNPNAVLKINLLFCNGHYNVITSLTSAFCCNFYCESCHTPYDHKLQHRCLNICTACMTVSPPCVLDQSGILCLKCNRLFKNPFCLAAHQGDVCTSVKKCKDCHKGIFVKKRKSKHVCGEVYCKICGDFKEQNHKCYMQKDTKKPMNENFLFIFFDFETRQDETMYDTSSNDTRVHKVNLCVSQQYCYKCIDNNNKDCEDCQYRTKVFKEDPVLQFMNYVLDCRRKYKSVCALAHNGQGFDFQFILKYIMENTKFTPELIMRGSKIILLELDNVRFVDSFSYFPMSLAALPKAFDLPPEKNKGYFPHLFNTQANQNYVGPLPDKEYYCPDSMFDKNYENFQKWYNEQLMDQDSQFDFQKEILQYCINDVEVLALACIKFRALFLVECGVDPFLEAVTIASSCNLAFRRNFLQPNTIGLIPKHGYRLVDNQSAAALQWMSYEEEQRNVRIHHAGRGREIKISGMKVDGFDGERIYEYNGCYYHGCPKCFPFKRDEPLKEDPSDTLNQRYERTTAKIVRLSQSEYEVVQMWDCQFNALKQGKNLNHLNSLPILCTLPLDPRNAFYGGRTGNTKTYHKCNNGETINYVDVCSLYPFVCKYGKYPIGHPNIHVGNHDCMKQGMEVDGLLKCKVLPPLSLYHPVLPTRMGGKLMFVLCRTCGETQNPYDCDHSYEERALTGTWTMDEIREAIRKGYIILDMYELWEYNMATFETGGLFTDFINKFLKIKQEASGYPSWVMSEDDKKLYIKQYFDHEGILLEKSKIQRNSGLRSLGKLILNSFWGKFGQRENQSKALIIRDPKEFFKLLTTPEIQVNTVTEINEEVLLVNWQYKDEVGESLRSGNVVIAAYTTAQARLELYKYLDALKERVLYYDTDAVLYTHSDGQYRIPTGDYLGQMTDELVEYGKGSYISEFISGGPKTYAYRVNSTNEGKTITICKVKGLTLNHKTSQLVNFEALKNMVLNEGSEDSMTIQIEQNRIRRAKDKSVITVNEKKVFKINGLKRRHEGEFDTLPYGYKKLNN